MAPVSARTRQYIVEIWEYRYFWYSLAKMDVRSRYRRSILGVGWALLHPLAMTAVLSFVFHRIFGLQVGHYALFIMSGMMVWTFLSSMVMEGCLSFQRAEGYIRTYSAPLAIFPLRAALGVSFHLVMTLGLTLVFSWYLRGPQPPTVLLSLFPTGMLLFLFGWSIGVLFAIGNVYFQDTQHLAQIGLQILFYLTPVLYPPGILVEKGLDIIPRINPLGSFFELFRMPILEGQWPTMNAYATALLVTFAAALLAAICLARLERRIVFQL